MKNAHDVLREEKKKQLVRIVSEEELEKLEATPITTESLYEELPPVVDVVVDFPDGSERLVKVRRFNNAEAFSGMGVYAFVRDDGTIDEDGLSKDEKVELSLKIKHQTVVVGMEDPMLKFAGSEGKGYPVEALGSAYLNLFFDAVNKVNNPPEVQAFLRNFREANENGTGETSDSDAGEEGSKVSQETERDDSASVSGAEVSTPGGGN